MNNEHKDSLKLQEVLISGAMPRGWAWKCSGVHVEAELDAENVEVPENAIDCRTVVKSFDDGLIAVSAEWNERGDLWREEGRGKHSQTVGIVYSMEELHAKFPQLFELEGGMYPFA